MMDFKDISSDLATSKGVPMPVLSPDEQFELYAVEEKGKWGLTTKPNDKPCVLYVVGQDSERFRQRKARMFMEATKRRNKTISYSEAEEEALETVCAGVVGWDNIPWDGALMEFTDENLKTFLRGYGTAYKLVNDFIVQRGNFSKALPAI